MLFTIKMNMNSKINLLTLLLLSTITLITSEIVNDDPTDISKWIQSTMSSTANSTADLENLNKKQNFKLISNTNFNNNFNNSNNFNNNNNNNNNDLKYESSTIITITSHNNLTNFKRLSNILNLFNIEEIGNVWTTISDKLSYNCSTDVRQYLEGLQNGKIWALKMDDASGHYTSGFYYGNNYFTGSLPLCTSIYKNDFNERVDNPERKVGFSFANGYKAGATSNQLENPPFHPGFFIVKLLVNDTSIMPVPRLIQVGLCLPTSCSLSDVKKLTKFSHKIIENHSIQIMGLRSPTQKEYRYWEDSTFIILLIVSSLVLVLIIIGTFYEILINYETNKKLNKKHSKDSPGSDTSSEFGCTTYDLTKADPNKNVLDIGIGMPHGINNNNNSDENLAVASVSSNDGKLSIYSELLLSFSLITNFNAICDGHVGNDTIPSIHGLRAISMAWVILGHTCIIVFKYSDNMELRKVVEKEFLFQTVTNGAFSVDTFFFMSGFLVSYIYFRTNAKGKLEKLTKGVNDITAGTYHFFGLLFYRFVRLTSPYLFVLGVVEILMKYFEASSVFDPPTLDHENCPKYWWRNVLYINTLFPVDEMCMLWSWYLSDDTQFFVIGAIILIIAVRHFKTALSILMVFMVSSWITTGYVAFTNNHMPNSDDPLALFDQIYDKPWTRLGPYLIGMGVGWILYKTNCKIKMNLLYVTIGWIISSACLLAITYGLYNRDLTLLTATAYSALSHSAWALCLAWIVIACSTGYGGYVNSLLSASWLYPFSRITYCAYLVHPIIIRVLALKSDTPLHLGTDSMVIIFFGQVVLSYGLAFIVSMSFEAPVVTMLKILSPNRKKRNV